MDASDLAFAGVARQADMVRSREVSPRELVELHLERIERLDPQLNAFRVVYADRALAEADCRRPTSARCWVSRSPSRTTPTSGAT